MACPRHPALARWRMGASVDLACPAWVEGVRPRIAWMITDAMVAGHRWGKLTGKRLVREKGKELRVLCQCDCGVNCTPLWGSLNQGRTSSCGCGMLVNRKYLRALRCGWSAEDG